MMIILNNIMLAYRTYSHKNPYVKDSLQRTKLKQRWKYRIFYFSHGKDNPFFRHYFRSKGDGNNKIQKYELVQVSTRHGYEYQWNRFLPQFYITGFCSQSTP